MLEIPRERAWRRLSLVACRAQLKAPNKCGAAKQETTLTVLTPAGLSLAPATRDFGTHATGTSSAVQTFTVTNTGGAPSGVPAVALTGDAAQFPLRKQLHRTRSPPARAAASTPPSLRPQSAPGTPASGSSRSPAAAPPRCSRAPRNAGEPDDLAGAQDFGTACDRNDLAGADVHGHQYRRVPSGTIATSVAGADAGQFTKSADNCNGQTLAPGASCTVDAAFAPTAVGAKAASLQASACPGGTARRRLRGTGATPANLTIAPTPHDFGTHATRPTSPAQTFTVTNTGGVPSGTIATVVDGRRPGQFAKSADNCDGQALGAGGHCTVDRAFAPTSAAPRRRPCRLPRHRAERRRRRSPERAPTPAQPDDLADPARLRHQVTGATTAGQTFTVTNNGGVPSGQSPPAHRRPTPSSSRSPPTLQRSRSARAELHGRRRVRADEHRR